MKMRMRSKDVRLRLRLRTISDSEIYPEKLSLVKKFFTFRQFHSSWNKICNKDKEKGKGWMEFYFYQPLEEEEEEEFLHANYSSSFLFSWFHTPSLNLKLSLRIKVPACTKMLTNHTHTELVSNSICNYTSILLL